MAHTTMVRKIGDSLGFILPKSLLESLGLKEGDELYITSTPEGLSITPHGPDFSDAL